MTRTILLCAMLTLGTLGWAFDFQPITADLDPTGAGSIKTFKLANPSEETIAVRVTLKARSMTPEGEDILTPADEKFVVFPSRVTLKPGASQSVRVQWRGGAVTGKELAFRIIAEQLPVSFVQGQKSGGSIQLLYRYLGTVYIVPERAKPSLSVISAAGKTDQDGKQTVELTLENSGTSHVIMQDLKVLLSSDGSMGASTAAIEEDALEGMEGANVLAGHRRIFIVPWPEGLPEGTLRAELKYTQSR